MKISILGAGLTGLVLGYIFKEQGHEVHLYSENIGGQHNNGNPSLGYNDQYFPLGPRILHMESSLETLFLRTLGIFDVPRDFKVGYDTDAGVRSEANFYDMAQYNKKTRKNEKAEASFMSGGQNKITGWDIDEINLVGKLTDALRDNITLVKVNDRKVIIDIVENSDKTFCTFNALSLLNVFDDFGFYAGAIKLDTTTFVHIKPHKDFDLHRTFLDKGYSYVYNTKDNLIKRITMLRDGTAVIEVLTDTTMEAIPEVVRYGMGKLSILQLRKIPNIIKTSQKISTIHLKETNKPIFMEGRFATMDHACKISTTIEKYFNYNLM